jgi:hypothetical protein
MLLSGTGESAERTNPKEAKPQSKQSPLQKEETADQKQFIESAQPTIGQPLGPNPNQETTKPEARQQKADTARPANSEWWFNLFLVIFTGVLAGLGVMQASLIKRQATYMRRSNRRTRQAAEAAMKAANVAGEYNKQAREAAHIELRAYVLISNVEFTGSDRLDWQTRTTYLIGDALVLTFRNSGRTPAYNLSAWVNCHLIEGIETRLPEDFSYSKYPETEPTLNSTVTLSPDHDHPMTFGINPDDVATARKRRHALYFFGEANYVDVFRNEQSTPFCFLFYVSPSGREGFITYDQHNDPT